MEEAVIRDSRRISLLIAAALTLAAAAPARSGATGVDTSGAAAVGSAGAPPGTAPRHDAEDPIETIRSRGARVPAAARARAESRLEAAGKRVDEEAGSAGETRVASRLAVEFGTPAEVLIRDRARRGCGWGDLVIALTLIANSGMDMTPGQLLAMHHEGAGWGQIAAGLALSLDDAVRAVRVESRVARGTTPADGRVAVIRGEGARHATRTRARA